MTDNFTYEEKAKFSVASDLSKENRLIDAIPILEELASGRPDCALFQAVLANAYWESGNLSKAEDLFQLAARLKPKWEKASLGLFHVLWDQRKHDEALNEIKRFMTISYSADYDEFIKEINENIKGLPASDE
jgi:tetratricopeptide (TPR) repeat protein